MISAAPYYIILLYLFINGWSPIQQFHIMNSQLNNYIRIMVSIYNDKVETTNFTSHDK